MDEHRRGSWWCPGAKINLIHNPEFNVTAG